MANRVQQGGELMLFIYDDTAKKYVSIALATSHTLSISADTKETSTKDNGGLWQDSEIGLINWSITSENMFAADSPVHGKAYDDLFGYMVGRKKLKAVFALHNGLTGTDADKTFNVPTAGWNPQAANGYEGEVIVTSLELNAPNGDNATFSVSLQGCGELKKVTA